MKKILLVAAFGMVLPLIGLGRAEACPCAQKSSSVCTYKVKKEKKAKKSQSTAKKDRTKKTAKNKS